MALHLVLIPVFPLLAVCLWFLLRAEQGVLAGTARAAALVHACFSSALDTINGVATGTLVAHLSPGSGDDQKSLQRPVPAGQVRRGVSGAPWWRAVR